MRIPVIMPLHPVGVGATRAMNVLSAKLWTRALVDLLPDVAFMPSWLPYAEMMIDRERGIRDALRCAELCSGAVAVGGDFSRGMHQEWQRFGELGLIQIDLTKPPMPSILSFESFGATQTAAFREAVTTAFQRAFAKRAA